MVGLGGCYMPIRFDAEIAIHRTGHYEMLFDGYLAKVELYKYMKERKIDSGEDKEAGRDRGVQRCRSRNRDGRRTASE